MSEFSSYIQLLANYGWSSIAITAGVGLIYLAVLYLGKKISKNVSNGMEKIANDITTNMSQQNENLINIISKQNDKLVDFIISNENTERETHKNMMGDRMSNSTEINMKMKDVMNINNAFRIILYEFHNSVNNLCGIPFAKFTVNYEWFGIGCHPIASKLSAVPFSMISGVVNEIMEGDGRQLVIEDISRLTELSPTLFSLFTDDGANGLIFNAMYDSNNMMIGLLMLEYDNGIPATVNLQELKIDTAQITSILNLRYKYSKC